MFSYVAVFRPESWTVCLLPDFELMQLLMYAENNIKALAASTMEEGVWCEDVV